MCKKNFKKKFSNTTHYENCSMNAKKWNFQVYVQKVTKSAPVPPLLNIAILIQQNGIFSYMCEKVAESALVEPIMKIVI